MDAEPRYAGLGRRLAAAAADLLLLFIAIALATYIAVPEVADEDALDTLTSSQENAIGLATLLAMSIWINYMIWSEWRWGRTIGKALLDIQVRAARPGEQVTWNRSLLRNLLKPFDLVAIFFTVPTSPQRQSLGDRAAQTIVTMHEQVGAAAVSEPVPPQAEVAPPGESVPPPAPPVPTAAPATSATWGPSRVLIGFGLLLLISMVGALVAGAIDPDLESLGATLVLQSVLVMGMVIAALVAAAPSGGLAEPRFLGLGPSLKGPWRQAVLAYLAYIGCAVVISLVLSPEQEDITRELGYGEGWLGAIAAGVLIIVAAPLSEEIFFRGFFFAGLRSRAGFWVAAAISSAVWGLFHYTGPDAWPVVLQLAIFGLILCKLYEETGSIRACIAVHAVNNAIAFAVLTAG